MKQAILLLVLIGVICGSALTGMYLNADGTVVPTTGKVVFAVTLTLLNAAGVMFMANEKDDY